RMVANSGCVCSTYSHCSASSLVNCARRSSSDGWVWAAGRPAPIAAGVMKHISSRAWNIRIDVSFLFPDVSTGASSGAASDQYSVPIWDARRLLREVESEIEALRFALVERQPRRLAPDVFQEIRIRGLARLDARDGHRVVVARGKAENFEAAILIGTAAALVARRADPFLF